MKNKAKLILASAVFVAALMLLVPLAQTDMSGGGGIGNSDSDPIVLSANDTSITDLDGLNDAIKSGGTITLGKSISITGNDSLTLIDGTTLDLNGYTLTINTINDNNSNRLVVAEGATVTIQNGTIVYNKSAGSAEGKSPIRVGSMKAANSTPSISISESNLTLDRVNITSAEYGVTVFGKANLTVNDSNITAVSSAISTNGNAAVNGSNSCGSTITINEGQYTSTNTAAIYFPGGDKLDVNGGTFTGKTGFDIRSGTVTISGATINVFGSPNEIKSGDGPTSWGMGIAVFNMSSYGQDTSGKYTTLNVTVTNTSINNAVYNVYVGDYKIITSGGDEGKFDVSNISASYTAQHSLNCSIAVNNGTTSTSSATIEQSANPTSTLGTRSADGAVPTIDIINNRIFANGISITISNGTNNASKITYGDNITFIDNFDLSKFTIFGGYNNNGTTITSTSITMDGGEVHSVAGGGYGEANVTTSNVRINGGTAVYVAGGGWSTDSSTTVTTPNAMTNRTTTTHVTISDGEVNYAVGGGRLGYTYVETANLTIKGGIFTEIIAGGINGYTETATLIVNADTGKQIKSDLITSGNRGEVANANVTITDLGSNGSVNYISIGALTATTSTDGGPNAMFDKIEVTIDKKVTINKGIYLGGAKWEYTSNGETKYKSNPWDNTRIDSLGATDITITAPGRIINVADIISDIAGDKTGTVSPENYTIGSDKIWTINGASISNISKITCVDSGKLILKNNPDFVPAPLVDKNTGKIDLSTYNVTVEKTATVTTIFIDAKNVPEHINGAGTSGYWVGVGLKVPTTADFNVVKLITGWGNTLPSNPDWTSASAFDSHFGGETDLDYFTTYYDFGSSNNTSNMAYLLVNWDENITDYETYLIDFSKVTKKSSSSGGGIPITPPDVPDEPEPIVPDNGNITVPSIDDKKADELVHKAVSSGSDSISIIDTNNVEGEYTEVTVSKSDLETISKKIENNNNINSVSIETSEGDIILEKEVLNSILETTDADSISFEIEDAKDKLTEAQKEAVGDRPVYDINITAGNENITSFNGKTITISLPYTLKAGEDPENIVVYYVKEDGSLEKVNCTYKDGKVIFETDHLSKYVIGYEESDKPVTPDTPDNKKDDNNTIYYAVAAVIIILIIIALAYYFMKKKQ